jgi:hypothetical protein
MPKLARSYTIFCVTLCIALLAVCALVVVAQSGRRAKKSQAMPIPLPEATPTPTPTPAVKSKPAFSFIVGMDRFGGSSGDSLFTAGGVLRNCTERLNASPLVRAEISTRDISRGEAIRMAKAEKESYIVWIQLHTESDIAGNTNSTYIEYVVLAPTTAKRATQGNSYPGEYRNKGINLPTTNTISSDYYLNLAARSAAERILDHFHIPLKR